MLSISSNPDLALVEGCIPPEAAFTSPVAKRVGSIFMDTWATASITPQLVGHYGDKDDFLDKIFPMDLRPQAHEIIRTWLFYTVVRSHLEHGGPA